MLEMKPVACFVNFIVLAVLGDAVKIPSYVQLCRRDNPTFDACVVDSIEALRPRLANGIPSLGLPPLEPFTLPGLVVTRDIGSLSMRLRVKNIRAFGGSQFVIESLVTDLDNLTMTGSVRLPVVYAEGSYEVSGNIDVIPLRGKGVFKGNFTDIRAELASKGNLTSVHDVRRLGLAQIKAKIRVKGTANMTLTNHPVTGTGPGVVDTVSKFVNAHQKLVFAILYPVLDEAGQVVIAHMAESILKNIDFDELVPGY